MIWDGLDLNVSPTSPRIRTARSQRDNRAKLCRWYAWFLRPGQLRTVPYSVLPMPIFSLALQLLMQVRMGSHALPVEQDGLARQGNHWHLRCCTLCETQVLGNERQILLVARNLPAHAVDNDLRPVLVIVTDCDSQ